MKPLTFAAILISLVALVGCRRSVSSDQTHELTPGNLKSVDLPAARSIVADFVTKDNVSVKVYLVRTEDAAAALEKVRSGLLPEQAMSKTNYLTVVEGPSGAISPPKGQDKVAWSLLFTTKTATSVTVKTKAGG